MGSEGEHHLRFPQSRKWNAWGGGNEFLTEHMVFSAGRAVKMPSCDVDQRQVHSRVPADRIRILGRD